MTYYWDTAIALAKLMGWALVVFAFLARRVGRSTSVWGDVMRQVFVLIVIVHYYSATFLDRVRAVNDKVND